jgi:hypothetical protein
VRPEITTRTTAAILDHRPTIREHARELGAPKGSWDMPEELGVTRASTTRLDAALRRLHAEILDGLRHGYFEFTLTSEVIGHGRRRLVLRAGKSYQFVIPGDECEDTQETAATSCAGPTVPRTPERPS